MNREFHAEYERARRRYDMNVCFEHVLSQHAVVMVDIAKNNSALNGIRLGQVNAAWSSLLSNGLDNSSQSQLDKEYRRAVKRVIDEYTRATLDPKSNKTLFNMSSLHMAHVASHSKANLEETSRLFAQYSASLADMFNRSNGSYEDRAWSCLVTAHSLGMWLDKTIFR